MPKKHLSTVAIATILPQASKVDRPIYTNDVSLSLPVLRGLTNSVYVGKSIIYSHISNVNMKVMAKVPQIIIGEIIRI
jgi:hypothetical protein